MHFTFTWISHLLSAYGILKYLQISEWKENKAIEELCRNLRDAAVFKARGPQGQCFEKNLFT